MRVRNSRVRVGVGSPTRSRLEIHSVWFFVLLGAVSAAGPAALDMYIPALPSVAADLAASPSATQLTIAFYLAGLALGQVVFGQLSDVFGRRRPLLAGLALFALASAACAVAPSAAALDVARLAQGLGGASGMVMARAVVRDVFDVTTSARYYSRLTLIYGVAPIAAPVVGSLLLGIAPWPSIFFVLAALGGVLLAAALRWFPETHPSNRRQPGSLAATGATFAGLLRDRRFVGCTVTLALTMGALVAYVATAAFVIQDGYGVAAVPFAVLFGGNALLMVASNQANAHLLGRFSPARLSAVGIVLLSLGAIGLVLVAAADLGLAPLEVSLACLMSSWGFLQGNILAIGLANQAATAGAASALVGLTQYAGGAITAPLGGLGDVGSVTALAAVVGTCSAGSAMSAYLLVLRHSRSDAGTAPPEPLDVI